MPPWHHPPGRGAAATEPDKPRLNFAVRDSLKLQGDHIRKEGRPTMQQINLQQMRADYRGKSYADLVRYHLVRQTQQQRLAAIQGTVALLPESVQPAVWDFVDTWDARASDANFWHGDSATVLDAITADARRLLTGMNVNADDDTLFDLFNLVTMHYACAAGENTALRQSVDVDTGSGFPVWSTLALLFPFAAFLRIGGTPASAVVQVGYTLAQLGYILFAAAVFTGTFRVFGLTTRKRVFAAAVVAFLVGTVLSNSGG